MMQKKFSIKRTFMLVTCVFLCACVTLKPEKTSSRAVEGLPQYWLTTSMYASSPDQQPITLSPSFMKATNIIPAGTLVQITGLHKLDTQFVVRLRVAKDRGQVSIFSDKDYILRAPENIKTKNELKSYLNNFLSKKDPHLWLLQARNYIQEGIWQKQPVIGMSKRELLACMGPATKKQSQKNPDTGNTQEIWHYADYFIVIDEPGVTKVKKLKSNLDLAKK